MSFEYFENDCPGCKPVLLDQKTMRQMPETSPEMQAVLGVWAKTTLEERQAFHRFTCQNSRTPADMAVMSDLGERMRRRWSGERSMTDMESKPEAKNEVGPKCEASSIVPPIPCNGCGRTTNPAMCETDDPKNRYVCADRCFMAFLPDLTVVKGCAYDAAPLYNKALVDDWIKTQPWKGMT